MVSDPPVSDPPVSDPPAEPHVCGAYSPPCVLCVERDLSLYPRLAAFSRVVCRVCPAQHSDSACEHCFNLILYVFVKIINNPYMHIPLQSYATHRTVYMCAGSHGECTVAFGTAPSPAGSHGRDLVREPVYPDSDP